MEIILPHLNLPTYNIRLREVAGKYDVFDPLRRKYVALTPEEWVRKHFVNFLIEQRGYPSGLMANEVSLNLNGLSRRCDTVVYDRHVRPRVIVEYKRPTVRITQKVFDQISRYNIVMQVDYLIISNGLDHYCCKMDYEHQTYAFIQNIPNFSEVTSD